MTQRQRIFCNEYLIDPNATQAAIKAGYAPKYASINASKLLQHPAIKEYIEKRLEEIKTTKTADIVEVMEYLTSVLRGESRAEVIVVEGIGDGCSNAVRVKKAPDEKDRLRAAELLGKRYGLFTDKVNVSGVIPVVIIEDLDNED